jgi:hypothetical protein
MNLKNVNSPSQVSGATAGGRRALALGTCVWAGARRACVVAQVLHVANLDTDVGTEHVAALFGLAAGCLVGVLAVGSAADRGVLARGVLLFACSGSAQDPSLPAPQAQSHSPRPRPRP